MSPLQEISGIQQPGSPTVEAFPGNSAQVERITEFGRQSHFVQSGQLSRKPPQQEGTMTNILSQARDLLRTSRQHSTNEVDRLKTMYGFQNDECVKAFLSSHRSAGSVLINALPQLQKYFGSDVVFNLQAIKEDDELQILYAVAVWRGPVDGAVAALESFDENWWLDQPTHSLALTFTYELA